MVARMDRTRTWRERMLKGLRAKCGDLQKAAARVDAVIVGPQFDLMTRVEKVQLLRRHAELVERIWALEQRINGVER